MYYNDNYDLLISYKKKCAIKSITNGYKIIKH